MSHLFLAEMCIRDRYYLDLDHVIRTIPINFDASYVAGRIFMVTGTGKYFKNITPVSYTHLFLKIITGKPIFDLPVMSTLTIYFFSLTLIKSLI